VLLNRPRFTLKIADELGEGTRGDVAVADRSARLKTGRYAVALIRIAKVKPLEGFEVESTLTTGDVIRRDLQHMLNGTVFDPIRDDKGQFRTVRVEDGTLVWPNGADLCPDVLIWDGLPPADVSSNGGLTLLGTVYGPTALRAVPQWTTNAWVPPFVARASKLRLNRHER